MNSVAILLVMALQFAVELYTADEHFLAKSSTPRLSSACCCSSSKKTPGRVRTGCPIARPPAHHGHDWLLTFGDAVGYVFSQTTAVS